MQVSRAAVLLEADGRRVEFNMPADALEFIDDDQATCKLHRRRGHVVITWPSTGKRPSPSQPTVHASATLVAEAAAGENVEAQVMPSATCEHQPAALNCIVDHDPGPRAKAGQRDSLDYSRFASIGDDDDDAVGGCGGGSPFEVVSRPVAPSPVACREDTGITSRRFTRSTSLDYSRFDDLHEDDATLDPAEVEKRWRRYAKLRRMRGEEPWDLSKWRKLRAKGNDQLELNPPGRGLWCKTNLEDEFERMADLDEPLTDDQLPPLAAPDVLSALSSAPGSHVTDATAWARRTLQVELVKACATNRGIGPDAREYNSDIRVDVIVLNVEVNGGNAAVLVQETEGTFICAYRFGVEARYTVNISERPAHGEEPLQQRFSGEIVVDELTSGLLPSMEAVTSHMKTSLPKDVPKPFLKLLRPLLGRLELSFAYFVCRFERQLLQWGIDSRGA